ncbi:TPA: LuxR C-terminal-related transcriptional regulator [Serratia fonticola]
MARILKILIVDPNQFFVVGLQQTIEKYFHAKGIPVIFMKQPMSYPMADLIFWAPGYPSTVMPIGLLAGDAQKSRLVILATKQRTHLVTNYVPWVFYRHQNHNTLRLLIDTLLASLISNNDIQMMTTHNSNPLRVLSPRQKEVMRYILKGMCSSEISKKLQIHEKTVSSHKRTAMGKLQLDRTADLYHWLLCDSTAAHFIS